MTREQLKPLDDVLRDWEVGAMDAAGTIEDLVALIKSLSSPSDETLRGALEEWRCTSCDETFDMSREPHVCPVCRSRDFEKLTRTAGPTDDVVERDMLAMLLADNKRMRAAGGRLAEAAIYTVHEYDGLHRLSLAIAEWSKAVANEGHRAALSAALQVEPSEAMIEAGCAALYSLSDFEGEFASLSNMSKDHYREKVIAVLMAAMRAAALRGDEPVAKEGKQR